MRKNEYVFLFILSIIILLEINSLVVLFLSGIFFFLIYYKEVKKSNKLLGVLRIMVLSLPFSFINIFGGSYGALPLSWYNIFLFVLIIIYLIDIIVKKKIDNNILSITSIIIIVVTFSIFIISRDYFDSLNDFFNNITPFILLIIGLHFRREIREQGYNILIKDYIAGTIISSMGIIIQYILISQNILIVGNYQFLGNYRNAYGYLFLDYSFLSLYITTGAILVILVYKKAIKYILFLFMLLASILTSARTGIVAFLMIYSMYNVFNIYKLVLRGKISWILLLIMNIVILIGSFIGVKTIRQQSITSDSGRLSLNENAIEIFKANPFTGIGFGSKSYGEIGGMLPHNLIFQSLAQGGLVYFIPLMLFFMILLWISFKHNIKMFYVVLILLMGSLFVPNIFSSRILGVIFLLIGLSIGKKKVER